MMEAGLTYDLIENRAFQGLLSLQFGIREAENAIF